MEFRALSYLCGRAERVGNIGKIYWLDVALDVLVDFVFLVIPELGIVQLLKMA